MSLEESMLELASAMREYAGVMRTIAGSKPDHFVGPAMIETTLKTRKRRTKAELAAAAFEESEEESEEGAPEERIYTSEDIRALIMQVKTKSTDAALGVLKAVGADTLSKIDPKDYPKVVELCAQQGARL